MAFLLRHGRTRYCLTLFGVVLLTSCSGGPKLYPVRGKVLFENQPA
jgi:hypothetical protein